MAMAGAGNGRRRDLVLCLWLAGGGELLVLSAHQPFSAEVGGSMDMESIDLMVGGRDCENLVFTQELGCGQWSRLASFGSRIK